MYDSGEAVTVKRDPHGTFPSECSPGVPRSVRIENMYPINRLSAMRKTCGFGEVPDEDGLGGVNNEVYLSDRPERSIIHEVNTRTLTAVPQWEPEPSKPLG
jgi:hypothetical protein